MVFKNIFYCEKAILVHKQVPDAAYDNNPDHDIQLKNMVTLSWFTVTFVYCEKAKLVHTQVPDAAYHVGPNQ